MKKLELDSIGISIFVPNNDTYIDQRTPARLIMGAQLRDRTVILKEQLNNRDEERDTETKYSIENHCKAQEGQISNFRGKKREFKVTEAVAVTNYKDPNRRQWKEATIERRIDRIDYLCRLEDGRLWKRHANQIIRRLGKEGEEQQRNTEENLAVERINVTLDRSLSDRHTNQRMGNINNDNSKFTELRTVDDDTTARPINRAEHKEPDQDTRSRRATNADPRIGGAT